MRTILVTKTIGRQHQSITPDTNIISLIAQIQAFPWHYYPHQTAVSSPCFIPLQTGCRPYNPSTGPEFGHFYKGVRL